MFCTCSKLLLGFLATTVATSATSNMCTCAINSTMRRCCARWFATRTRCVCAQRTSVEGTVYAIALFPCSTNVGWVRWKRNHVVSIAMLILQVVPIEWRNTNRVCGTCIHYQFLGIHCNLLFVSISIICAFRVTYLCQSWTSRMIVFAPSA